MEMLTYEDYVNEKFWDVFKELKNKVTSNLQKFALLNQEKGKVIYQIGVESEKSRKKELKVLLKHIDDKIKLLEDLLQSKEDLKVQKSKKNKSLVALTLSPTISKNKKK